VDLLDTRTKPPRQGAAFLLRAVLLVVVLPALVVVAYATFALQGHREDFPSQPMQTWPMGISSLALAAALGWTAIRPTGGFQAALVTISLVAFIAALATFLP
jgi:hypothetical protein